MWVNYPVFKVLLSNLVSETNKAKIQEKNVELFRSSRIVKLSRPFLNYERFLRCSFKAVLNNPIMLTDLCMIYTAILQASAVKMTIFRWKIVMFLVFAQNIIVNTR